MTAAQSLLRFGLVPSDDSLPHIRALLDQEAEAERNGLPREDDLAFLCCVQLFSRGFLEDVLRVWRAKRSGMDLAFALDVEQLCGAGLEKTRSFLASNPDPEAAAALKHIDDCEDHFIDVTGWRACSRKRPQTFRHEHLDLLSAPIGDATVFSDLPRSPTDSHSTRSSSVGGFDGPQPLLAPPISGNCGSRHTQRHDCGQAACLAHRSSTH
jgi:hypothetical protein